MSYSFFVRAPNMPPIAELLRRIAPADLLVVNEALLAQWPNATITLCRRLRSTRGVRLSFAKDEIEIKTNIFSANEDYELAYQLVVAAAEVAGSQPRGEFTHPMPPEKLIAAHDQAWIKESLISALNTTRMLVQDRGTVGLSGPFRACNVGPRVLEQVGRDGDATAIESILALMRRVQWIHTDGYEAASDFTISQTDQHLAIWFPDKRMFLPKVHWINVGIIEPYPTIPFERLAEVLGKPLVFIDENQPLIEPTPSEDVPALVVRARQFHISPMKAASRPSMDVPALPTVTPAPPTKLTRKPWWKVW